MLRIGLILLGCVALAGCGGGGGGGVDNDDPMVTIVLPGLQIFAVQSHGPGGDLDVALRLTAPPAGSTQVGVVAIATSLTFPAMPGTEVRNNIVSSTAGTFLRSGIDGIPSPTAGTSDVTFTISGTLPTMLPSAVGVVLTVRMTDTFSIATQTFTFEIEPPGAINEPFATWVAPTGGTVRGEIPMTANVTDFESNPVKGTYIHSTDAGTSWRPSTLVFGSSPQIGSYTPTDPANTFAAAANQVVGVPAPGTVQVRWDSAADGVGLVARVPVRVRLLVEDGTTAGAGPFHRADGAFDVDNRGEPPAPSVAIVRPLGDAALTDPGGLLGGDRLLLGTNGVLVVPGSGFTGASVVSLSPAAGVLFASTELVSAGLLRAPFRVVPDGPDSVLADSGTVLALGARFVMVGTSVAGTVQVVEQVALISLSSNRFTVAPGGTFDIAVQIPSALAGDPVLAYAADIRFDTGALTVVSVTGGTNTDFPATPQTIPSPVAAINKLVVFADPVAGRAQLTEPVINVAVVRFRLQPGVIAGTTLHLWLPPTSLEHGLLTQGGTLLIVSNGLRLLGTSVLVQ